MVVAVMFSLAAKVVIEANRRPPTNYYRHAVMARASATLEGFTFIKLPGTFWEPSREFCNMTSVLVLIVDHLRFHW